MFRLLTRLIRCVVPPQLTVSPCRTQSAEYPWLPVMTVIVRLHSMLLDLLAVRTVLTLVLCLLLGDLMMLSTQWGGLKDPRRPIILLILLLSMNGLRMWATCEFLVTQSTLFTFSNRLVFRLFRTAWSLTPSAIRKSTWAGKPVPTALATILIDGCRAVTMTRTLDVWVTRVRCRT